MRVVILVSPLSLGPSILKHKFGRLALMVAGKGADDPFRGRPMT
jgi:hypothetical protein